MKLRIAYHIVLMMLLGVLTSCGDQMGDYIKTVQSGIATLPWPKQMEKLFGDGDHFIVHYNFSPGPREWQTEVFFYGRYRLTMAVDVDIDYGNHLVKTNVAPPKFYLFETKELILGPKGVRGAKIAGQWILDEAKWNKLVEAKGDWSVIGISVKTNSPIPGFDEYVDKERAPRVKIPH